MIEVSTVLFTLLVEGFAVLLVISCSGLFMVIKARRDNRAAAKKLVQQIKQQSTARMEQTGSFFKAKFDLEGSDLTKAIKTIDKAEKKFYQHLLNIYLKRDAKGLSTLDADVAELIETYKTLTPVMRDQASLDTQVKQELTELRESKQKLTDELDITKTTMASMINEFGNLFGGGKEHELAKHEVLDKVKEKDIQEDIYDDDIEMDHVDGDEVDSILEGVNNEPGSEDQNSATDESIDDLIDAAKLSNDKVE